MMIAVDRGSTAQAPATGDTRRIFVIWRRNAGQALVGTAKLTCDPGEAGQAN
jgi:hypothetical protein